MRTHFCGTCAFFHHDQLMFLAGAFGQFTDGTDDAIGCLHTIHIDTQVLLPSDTLPMTHRHEHRYEQVNTQTPMGGAQVVMRASHGDFERFLDSTDLVNFVLIPNWLNAQWVETV